MVKIVLIIFGAIIILAALIVIGDISFNREAKNKAEELFKKSKETEPEIEAEIVTEADIKDLPEPVQRYLKYTQIIGKEKIKTVRLKQGGYFRMQEDQKWMPLEAEQYFNVDSAEFIWVAKVKFAPFLYIYAKDEFIDGRGNLVVKLLGLITVADARGYEVDHGELMRFLAECIWFPSAFLNDYMEWEAVDKNSARATITYGGTSASVTYHFNEKGEVTSITAKRYREVEGEFVLEDWEGQILEYREFNGLTVPSRVNIIWKLDTGDFCYDRIEVVDIEYNEASVY